VGEDFDRKVLMAYPLFGDLEVHHLSPFGGRDEGLNEAESATLVLFSSATHSRNRTRLFKPAFPFLKRKHRGSHHRDHQRSLGSPHYFSLDILSLD